ncbi:MAG: TolC family protein [Flavobacteriales bacterium]
MKMKQNLSYGLLCLFFGLTAQAQKYDLATCLRMADSANVQIRNAQLDVAINESQRSAYLSSRLPSLNFVADYKYNAIIPGQVVPAQFFGGAPGTFAEVKFGVPIVLSNTVQLNQILFNSQVNYGLAALRINSDIVKIKRDMTIQEVKYQVANTYFILQGVYQQLQFLDSNATNVKRMLKNMDLLVSQGMLVPTEADKLRINLLGIENNLSNLLATKAQLEELFKIMIGLDPKSAIQLHDDQMVQQTLLVDPEQANLFALQLLEQQQKMALEEAKGIKMGYLPNLNLYGIYQYNVNINPETDFRTGIDGAFVGLRMDWNLFDGLDKHHKAAVNALKQEQIQAQQDLTRIQLQQQAEQNKRNIEVKAQALDVAKEQLTLATSVHKNAELKYKEGLISVNDFLLAETGLEQAQAGVVAAYVTLRQAELEYLKTNGNIK